MDRKHLVLIGLMGAGKTTVGRACAARLGRPFVDTDDLVVALAGMPFEELWASQGEPGFRAFERQAVKDACASPEPLVIACGGGAATDLENRRRLRDSGTVVWLRAPVAVLSARVGDGSTRPLLHGDPQGALARLDVMRAPAYEASADVAVETGTRSVAEVADAVLAACREAVS